MVNNHIMCLISLWRGGLDYYEVSIGKGSKNINNKVFKNEKDAREFILFALAFLFENKKDWIDTVDYIVGCPVNYTRFAHKPGDRRQH